MRSDKLHPSEKRVYLDQAGFAPVLKEVVGSLAGLPEWNPTGTHAEGRAALDALDRARDQAASALDVPPAEIVFCSSGTEAVNLALLGLGRRLGASARIVTWESEHSSVLGAVRQLGIEGHPISLLPVDGAARADPGSIPEDAGLVSIGLANSELGTLQPVTAIAARAEAVGAMVHIDACQGPQWMAPELTGCHLASFSGHKLGAGSGAALWIHADLLLQPLQFGGVQERGRRPGREDVRGATAVAVALATARIQRQAWSARARRQAARLTAALAGADAVLTGGEPRLPNYATAAFASVRGEDLLVALDLAGLAAGSGSPCASGSLDPSHVLLAAGFGLDLAQGSLRLTTGPQTTEAEIEAACEILAQVLPALGPKGEAHPAPP